ncbi:monooxygenase [Microbacteriaceae bacterium 4G12]
MKLLQIDFRTDGPWEEEMSIAFTELATLISETEGLVWKIWTENKETQEAGGIYLFMDEQSLQANLTEHTARLRSFGITDIRAKIFNVNEPLTKITGSLSFNSFSN